jgi:hypothetical protein
MIFVVFHSSLVGDGYVFAKRFSAAVVDIGNVSQGKIVCSGFCSPMVIVASVVRPK